ncbi:hypothetical protein H4J50_07880 [Colwellia sp. 6M3]|jgi:hypothetical protein|uniref:hypothetical protein n=1 Tax=Colwellia sp. 6M3 TaxID=2759849 RepID=UPI0015F3FFC6|nr:hypothetical protein [Colwellia sp. 6M3]MBA6415932.1 hypothetical protein [Colwellia sp. 6M3]|tara:strand:- start:527 stop:988 length:462 start_codon:yes stop_codon:yes gene_type:complete
MSFVHKSVWVQFLITVFIAYYYGSEFAHLYSTEQLSDDNFTSLLFSTAIQLVILNIAVHTIVALLSNKDEVEQERDERDILISLKGGNIAYNMLSTWVVFVLVSLWATSLENARYYFDTLSGEFNVLNILLVGFLVAEILRFSYQLFYYQKGV